MGNLNLLNRKKCAKTNPKIPMNVKGSLLLISILAANVICWHSTGHLTVARIAALDLQKFEEGQKALAWANKLLQPYTKVCGEDKWPFTECATWPDKVKAQGYWMMAGWHFTDNRYYKPGYVPPPDKKEIYQNQNAVWAIKDCMGSLMSKDVDTQGKSDSSLMKSISLRNLIHFVGDIHQPLHTTGRFSAEHPDGDMGGNLFPIKHYSNPQWNNLHFIWDHLFDMGQEIESPLTQEENDWLTQWSEDIMALHPYEKLKEQMETSWSPESWDTEGFNYVKTFVYNGIKEGEEVPQDYQDAAKKIVKLRLALGGYRLSHSILYVYRKLMNGGQSNHHRNDPYCI